MSLSIDYDKVEKVVSNLKTSLAGNQSDVNDIYSKMASAFADSCGEEATALRDVQTAEKALMGELIDVLSQFGDSIQFAADEFKDLDKTGASQMGVKP